MLHIIINNSTFNYILAMSCAYICVRVLPVCGGGGGRILNIDKVSDWFLHSPVRACLRALISCALSRPIIIQIHTVSWMNVMMMSYDGNFLILYSHLHTTYCCCFAIILFIFRNVKCCFSPVIVLLHCTLQYLSHSFWRPLDDNSVQMHIVHTHKNLLI